MNEEIKATFSKIGFSYLLFLIAGILAILIYVIITYDFDITGNYALILEDFISNILPIPILLYLLRNLEKKTIEKHSLSLKTFILAIALGLTLIQFGGLISDGISEAIGSLFTTPVVDPVEEALSQGNIIVVAFLTVIIGPVFEELIYRKVLIDRTIKYGVGISVFTSAFLFALMHGTVSQLFYAFFLGVLLAYLYIETGNILYPILLHMCLNLFSVIPMLFNEEAILSLTISPDLIGMLLYVLVYFLLLITGIVVIIKDYYKIKELLIKMKDSVRLAIVNKGMICFLIYSIIMMIMSF